MDQQEAMKQARALGEAARAAGVTLDDHADPSLAQIMHQCHAKAIPVGTILGGVLTA